MVRKGLTFMENEMKHKTQPVYTEIIPTENNKERIFILNAYSTPSHKPKRCKSLLHKAGNIAKDSKLHVRRL